MITMALLFCVFLRKRGLIIYLLKIHIYAKQKKCKVLTKSLSNDCSIKFKIETICLFFGTVCKREKKRTSKGIRSKGSFGRLYGNEIPLVFLIILV